MSSHSRVIQWDRQKLWDPKSPLHWGQPSATRRAGVCAADSPCARAAAASLQSSGLIRHGGVATSLVDSEQQWDFPNAWPPLVHMGIEGLEVYGGKRTRPCSV